MFEQVRTPRWQAGRIALLAMLVVTPATPTLAQIDASSPAPPTSRISGPPLDRSDIPRITWTPAGQVPVWKTIRLGTFTSVNALLEALDSDTCGSNRQHVAETSGSVHVDAPAPRSARHCHLGESAGAIIGRPAFRLSRARYELDLVVRSLTELGFAADAEVSKESIYERAELLGFALCPAEAAVQLRLQYLDQPIGEFLQVAMPPISTWAGEATDLTVGNGGAGLLLVGGNGAPGVTLPATAKLVFVRPRPER